METCIPLGLEFYVSAKKFGDIEAHSYYLSEEMFQFNSEYEDLRTFNYLKPRLEHRFIYAYPIWRTTDQIDEYQIDIGKNKNIRYYGILPTSVDIELSLRGGVDHTMSTFVSNRIEDYISENEPYLENIQYYGDSLRFRTYNTVFKIGAIFQRKIATRFDTRIDGNDYHAASYKTEGFYVDLSFLVTGGNSEVDVEYGYFNNGNVLDYQQKTESLSARTLFKKRPIGVAVGYKQYVVGRSVGLPMRIRGEAGFQPGYFPTFKSSFYANVGFGIGIGTWN